VSRRSLYEAHPDYPDRVKLPLHLYGGGTVRSGESVAISIGARTASEALCDFELRNMIEDQITDLFLGLPSSQVVFAEQFALSGSMSPEATNLQHLGVLTRTNRIAPV